MSKMKLKDDICHLFVEQDNSEKIIIEVYFDISDFDTEQEVYDYFGEKIYGNGREHLNSIFQGTKGFGGGLSSFHDYLKCYLIGINLDKRNEFLSIKITNMQKKKTNEFWISFVALLMSNFFDSFRNVGNYADFFELKITKDIGVETMDHFLFLISDYANRPEDLLDENGNYL